MLALATAGDPDLLSIVEAAPAGQPAPNLFFAAVHYLLLAGASDRLAEFYPTLTAHPGSPEEAFPSFRAFCLHRRQAIEALLRTRRVQTNEVGRCAYLYPAFALVAELSRRPLAIIELGASAGLNLMWDRYRYEYDGDDGYGASASPVLIQSAFRGSRRPVLPQRPPMIVDRVGVDLEPIDVRDTDSTMWLRALVWPEHRERERTLANALSMALNTPPRVVRGDAIACLPALLRAASPDAAPCVFHTHTLNQMSEHDRADLTTVLGESARERVLYRVSAEWLDTTYPALDVTWWEAGDHITRRLAFCDPHGRWIEWRALSSR